MDQPMKTLHPPVTLAWLGDLHLTVAGLPNHRVAEWAVAELNDVVRPDLVQFAGDNVQDGLADQFAVFNALRERLTVPHAVLVGDHDVHEDPAALAFQMFVGATHGSAVVGEFRFIRLDTLDDPPLGLSDEQLDWFEAEAASPNSAGQRIVLCQHHYPFKVFEQFNGPGIDRWRRIVDACKPVIVLCGHTHYGQIANDGRCVYVATRSIGDPEGGPPGYALIHLRGEELAITHRASSDSGPILLITWPRDALLAMGPQHITSDQIEVGCRLWSAEPLVGPVQCQLDDGHWFPLSDEGDGFWSALVSEEISKGRHLLTVQATDAAGRVGSHTIRFASDPSGRFTPTPAVNPIVEGTQFC